MILLGDGNAIDIQVDPTDWPRCAVCWIPVENFGIKDLGDALVCVAQCHGQVESAMIPDDVWDTTIGTHVNFGLAFTTKENHETTTTLDV
jgi:hypothetical protein